MEQLNDAISKIQQTGTPGGDRTHDQQIKSLVLYQLSYRRICCHDLKGQYFIEFLAKLIVVELKPLARSGHKTKRLFCA